MGKAVFLLFDFVICAVEGYLYYSFCAHFLTCRYKETWKNTGIMAVGMAVLFEVNHLGQSVLNLFASSVICIILCMVLFKDSLWKKIYTWFVSWFIMVCSEFVVVGILYLPWGENVINTIETPARAILSIIMMKIVTLFVYRLICNHTQAQKEETYPAIAWMFFCLPIASFIVCFALCYLGDGLDTPTSNNFILISGCVLLLAANVIVFIICDRLIMAMNQVKEYELTETKRRLEEIHYKSVNEMNESVKAVLHNMNGVMQTLDALARNYETDQIRQVISGMQESLSEAGQKIYCGEPFIDAILSEKARVAHERRIKFHVFVEPGFTMIEMKPVDLINLVSNLLDNAIEAAEKCEDGYVNTEMFQTNDGTVAIMKFRNNYVEEPLENDSGFQTRKKDSLMHGLGLRQVKKLVEQYDGYIDIKYSDNVFEVHISFLKP